MNLEQWLGEDNKLGHDIWYKKYRYKDETLDQWFDRVSGGNKDLKNLIMTRRFLPGGRILSSRGLDKLGKKITYSNCFVENTKVLTKDGYKNIQDIKINEKVLTHSGEFQNVDNVLSKEYGGILYKIKTYKSKEIICTDEHPFLTENSWKISKDITKSNYIKFPKEKINDSDFIINLLDYLKLKDNQSVEELDSKIRIVTTAIAGNGAVVNYYSNWTNKTLIIDKDLKYVFGRWLGDGSITKTRENDSFSIFQIVFNSKESESFEYCKKILEEKLGLKTSCRENTEQSTLILRIESQLFSDFISLLFNNNCENKKINDIRLLNSMNLVYGIIDADGLVTFDGQIRLSLKNKILLSQIKETIERNGIPCGEIKKVKNNKTFYIYEFRIDKHIACNYILINLSKIYSDNRLNTKSLDDFKYKIINKDVFVRVKDISSFDLSLIKTIIPVYNLSVSIDNSYVVDNMVVHNCYVITPPNDNIESIFECAGKLARTFSYGGGCGVDISKLAPKGARVNNAAKETTGSVSFMDLYSLVTELIGQNGRRGALMLSLDCSHPDLEEFIEVKSDLNKVTKANISIKITNDFMKAVKEDGYFTLSFTRLETGETTTKTIKAKEIFQKIADMNWDFAEPKQNWAII